MSSDDLANDRLFDLLAAVCDGDASQEDFGDLNSIAAVDEETSRRYLDYCRMHSTLRSELRAVHATQAAYRHIGITPNDAEESDNFRASKVACSTSTGIFSATLFHGAATYLSSGWPVAYLIATVIFAIGLMIGARTYISQPGQVAITSPTPVAPVVSPAVESVGRITGMVDCKWNAAETAPTKNSLVSLGNKFDLASGLMEITYNTGATVILQGPVTYEIASKNGGFLSLGKLTGKVEVKQTQGFSIHTPMAIVTDLGTEFGVEVNKDGETHSHVFRGSVSVQTATADGKTEGAAHILRENESVRVEKSDGKCAMAVGDSAKAAGFARELPKRTIKTLDLVDVVAGGDGFSGRRHRAIDATNGQPTSTPAKTLYGILLSDGKYHPVPSLPFVDGVFIPDNSGSRGVQLDSAGHTFAEFGATTNETSDHIWASKTGSFSHTPAILDGVDYSAPEHGFLFMHANKGITFDLGAIRKANPGQRVLRFRSVVGTVDGLADVRVFIDGQPRFQRRQINSTHGAMSIDVKIAEQDRFLTLASTDGGDGIKGDWIIFGDPRLELSPTTAAVGLAPERKAPIP